MLINTDQLEKFEDREKLGSIRRVNAQLKQNRTTLVPPQISFEFQRSKKLICTTSSTRIVRDSDAISVRIG